MWTSLLSVILCSYVDFSAVCHFVFVCGLLCCLSFCVRMWTSLLSVILCSYVDFSAVPGEVGDWKNYFTMALSEQYDEVIEEKLKDYNLRFQYSI